MKLLLKERNEKRIKDKTSIANYLIKRLKIKDRNFQL